MERDDDRELWDALGRLPAPELSPFFARNVVRRIREESTRLQRVRSWFSLRRIAMASAAGAVLVGILIATHAPVPILQKGSPNDLDVVAKIDPQDYDVVADLDELIAWDENSVWEDKPTL